MKKLMSLVVLTVFWISFIGGSDSFIAAVDDANGICELSTTIRNRKIESN